MVLVILFACAPLYSNIFPWSWLVSSNKHRNSLITVENKQCAFRGHDITPEMEYEWEDCFKWNKTVQVIMSQYYSYSWRKKRILPVSFLFSIRPETPLHGSASLPKLKLSRSISLSGNDTARLNLSGSPSVPRSPLILVVVNGRALIVVTQC